MRHSCKFIGACVAASTLFVSAPASAQLRPWEGYTPGQAVMEVTDVKVDEGQLGTYLEGLKETWVKANEVSKKLGQITDYAIYAVPYGDHEVNLVLTVTYPNTAAIGPNRVEYDKFMAAWGKDNQDKGNKTVTEVYNKIRKIKGVYLLRPITINP